MRDADRFKLLFGPYRTPRVRIGRILTCEARDDDVIVVGFSDARIPWPTGQRRGRGARALVLYGRLADAIRRESNQAVAYWWGVTPQTVTNWRKALGVPRASISDAVQAMRLGATDFLTKPVDIDHLRLVVSRALRERAMLDELTTLREQLHDLYSFHDILSKSPTMHAVGEVPIAMQAKLLRVLQERSLERVGGTESVEVDVRVVTATNKDLRKLTAEGKFREDLYYRLNVVKIDLPPLRERPEDVPLLAAHFTQKYARPGAAPKQIAPEAMEVLLRHKWPGNIRELENAIERACVTSREEFIRRRTCLPT